MELHTGLNDFIFKQINLISLFLNQLHLVLIVVPVLNAEVASPKVMPGSFIIQLVQLCSELVFGSPLETDVLGFQGVVWVSKLLLNPFVVAIVLVMLLLLMLLAGIIVSSFLLLLVFDLGYHVHHLFDLGFVLPAFFVRIVLAL